MRLLVLVIAAGVALASPTLADPGPIDPGPIGPGPGYPFGPPTLPPGLDPSGPPCLESCREFIDLLNGQQPPDHDGWVCMKLSSGKWLCAQTEPPGPHQTDTPQ